MLQSLHIINFAIIKDTVLDPASGVTICTGETGSGKSIVIDALAVLMGRRAKTDFIRTGADYFKIEGVFYVDDTIIEDLQKEGIDTDGNQLIGMEEAYAQLMAISVRFASCRVWEASS